MSTTEPPSLNQSSSTQRQKRKRDQDEQVKINAAPFTIRLSSSDPFAREKVFTPICMLDRASLPLAYLDTASSGNRHFAAYIPTLERCHENGEQAKVLVVSQEYDGRLYAVERAGRCSYVLCRLGSWVERGTIEQLAHVVLEPREKPAKRVAAKADPEAPWWSAAARRLYLADTLDSTAIQIGLPKLGMYREQLRKSLDPDLDDLPSSTQIKQVDDVSVIATGAVQGSSKSTVEPLEELAQQYLDALYLSRTSLAYFAKGPLSRSRAVFTYAENTVTSAHDLIGFLRDALLSSTTSDRKDRRYREKIPEIIRELSMYSPEKTDVASRTKRRRKWRSKRDKAGFLPNETDCIEKWWRDEDMAAQSTSPESQDNALKRRLPWLRRRETYLHIIIVLEVLALEATHPPVEQTSAEHAPTEGKSLAADGQPVDANQQQIKPCKSKKAFDLRALLEILLERLNIAHYADSHSPVKDQQNEGSTAKDGKTDELRDFCTEIIIPFYMTRLPKEAAQVNRQLGGPSPPSPVKRQQSTSSRSKPGEPAVRKPPEKRPRAPLARLRTEILNQPPLLSPILHRSSTDSLLIKRETPHEPSLYTIPAVRRQRQDPLQVLSQTHRTINFEAQSKAAQAKIRKHAETEGQIQEALKAIAKPNRVLANSELAKGVDDKFKMGLSKGKKGVKQGQATPRVEAATPQKPRTTDIVPGTVVGMHALPPPSSVVPATSVRPRPMARLAGVQSTPVVQQTMQRTDKIAGSGIQETPSRSDQVVENGIRGGIAFAGFHTRSPFLARQQRQVVNTPAKVDDGVAVAQTPSSSAVRKHAVVEATPVKITK
ncbi:hypothetical protein B0A48_15176 [Cryoendolithus antarcticus]|uniref:DNA replication regulator Sld3 C-terminal domain-containing protein n=1 Tax=Cryoendolithus antarcticus TaxID=1507870 RepID=A0A1V8SIP4_9PEZI|nr:hypothetical protein B0A48_15176 [Cryoendolithus antarcticus]